MHRIAVVEDDSMMHKVLTAVYKPDGYELSFWTEGGPALEELVRRPPHLILLDVNLPDMTGHEVCRRLKADKRTARVPVLMLTGEARALADRVSGLDLGAEDYLFKPFSPKILLARTRALLGDKPRR